MSPFDINSMHILQVGPSTSADITKIAAACSIYPQVLSIEWLLQFLCPLIAR